MNSQSERTIDALDLASLQVRWQARQRLGRLGLTLDMMPRVLIVGKNAWR